MNIYGFDFYSCPTGRRHYYATREQQIGEHGGVACQPDKENWANHQWGHEQLYLSRHHGKRCFACHFPEFQGFGDDFAGSDVELSLGYVYNGQADDSHYVGFGLAPPAAGYDFLQGPIVPVYVLDENGEITVDDNGDPVLDTTKEAIWNFGRRPGYENLPMTSFVYFAAGSAIGDPELGEYVGTEEWYNLLRGFQPQPDVSNPVPYTNAITGADTKFTLDGDPTRATGWNDGNPLPAGDRRIVLNTGPFTMALGDTQEVVVALLGAVSSTQLRSVAQLKFTDQFVQDAYNSAFQVPSPPAAARAHLIVDQG